MKVSVLLAGVAALAITSPAFAQTEIIAGADATGVSEYNERINDIEDNVRDDFARSVDPERFGPASRRQGVFGSIALTYSGEDGNTETQDFSLAGRVNFNEGNFAQSVALALEFSENDLGEKDQEDIFAIYDAQYYFDDNFYAFALGRMDIDRLADKNASANNMASAIEEDGFLGFGPGYRVVNTPDMSWRVQAGVGVRYTSYTDDSSDTETGYLASSRFYYRVNDNFIVTNDTDYLTSDNAADTITNELAANFRMSEAFATRVSYRTEYEEDRTPERTDNILGVSLVYGF